jgi:hypothetical protein
LPDEALRQLDDVSALPLQFPYSFFEPAQQSGLHGGVGVGDKPAGYAPRVWTDAAPRADFGPDATAQGTP